MTVFYHVSTDYNHQGVFEPRIPSNRHQDQEDDKTPRICVSTSLEGCFTAIPNGGIYFDELVTDQRGYFLVFKIDTEKLGIEEDDIVYSDELYELDLVRDAEASEEVWIKTGFIVDVEDTELIKVTYWGEESYDVLPHSIYDIADDAYEGDYITAFQKIYDSNVPCGVAIKDVSYISENATSNGRISLDYDWDDEAKAICFNLRQCNNVKDIKVDTCNVEFTLIKDANIYDIFANHIDYALLSI